jgi:hypothetical protein
MNKFLNGLQDATNFTYTENGALTHKSTGSALMDLFGMGGAYRNRSDADCIILFKNAFEENEEYAMKCLFYIRDILKGQGERRFFRVCMKWLANQYPDAVVRNLKFFPELGRWDDLFCLMDTKVELAALSFIKIQLAEDVSCKTPSLLGKWMPSINTSSNETRRLANKVREYLGVSHKQYRKTLSILRERINVLERLMSAGEWDKIEYDKIPSQAGLKYRNAFAKHDVERAKAGVVTYESFIKDENTTVNAGALYPYQVVEKAYDLYFNALYTGGKTVAFDDTERVAINKYWDNLTDYFNEAAFDGLVVADVSGSMRGTPINVAISLGLYCAEKARGPFRGHFITFSECPELVKTEGVDFVDKVQRMSKANWGGNTNIEAVFDLLLDTAIQNHCRQEDLPKNIMIVSDMEFDSCACSGIGWGHITRCEDTLMETIKEEWADKGYECPNLIFWNVDCRNNNIPMHDDGHVTFVSGFSPSLFEGLMSGKTGEDFMYETLNRSRYVDIH